MPTARRSDRRGKEKGNGHRADDLGDHVRTNTTVYDRIRYAYSIYTVSIPYPAARAFLFTGGFLPYPAQLDRQFSEKGLTNRLECVIMCSGTHNRKRGEPAEMSDQKPKHPGGRPRQYEHPLTVDLKVRIDEPTNQRLQAFCAETGTQRATAVRQSVVEMLDRYDQTGTK